MVKFRHGMAHTPALEQEGREIPRTSLTTFTATMAPPFVAVARDEVERSLLSKTLETSHHWRYFCVIFGYGRCNPKPVD